MKLVFNAGHRVYEGSVMHARHTPKRHHFSYKLFYLLIDLDEINLLSELSPLWSVNKINLVQFRHKDYMNGTISGNLKSSVVDIILRQTQDHFKGKIFLLTNLRYWGYCFNPVSYYFCFNENGALQYIVDEVSNTPWKERYQYVHKINIPSNNSSKPNSHNKQPPELVFEFKKAFHVSPFMPMDMRYKTIYKISNNKILIHMSLYKTEQSDTRREIFFASMNLKNGQPLTPKNANLLPFRFPFQCSKIILSIYWQAFRLWIKRFPFYAHPN